MAVKRLSVSLPQESYCVLMRFVKQAKLNASQYINFLIQREVLSQEEEELRRQYDSLADDEEFQKESQKWVKFQKKSLARSSVLLDFPYDEG
jgi:hypothetical protein